jgi:hypothetical protein
VTGFHALRAGRRLSAVLITAARERDQGQWSSEEVSMRKLLAIGVLMMISSQGQAAKNLFGTTNGKHYDAGTVTVRSPPPPPRSAAVVKKKN